MCILQSVIAQGGESHSISSLVRARMEQDMARRFYRIARKDVYGDSNARDENGSTTVNSAVQTDAITAEVRNWFL